MKKRLAVAMAITAGLCFAGNGHLKPAFAGHWEEVPNPSVNQYGDPIYPDWVDEQDQRQHGTLSYSRDDYYDGHSGYSYEWKDNPIDGIGGMGMGMDYVGTVYGGQFTLNNTGKMRTKFEWKRDIDPITGLPDLSDNPPNDELLLKISGSAFGIVCSDTTNQDHDLTKESVTISLMGESGGEDDNYVPGDGSFYSGLQSSKIKLFAIPAKGQLDVWGPWINYGILLHVDGDRIIGDSPETPLPAQGFLGLGYSVSIDTRKLTLHRANAINETIDEDGNVHGDTTFSYLTQPSNTLTTNSQVFHPTFEGSWTNGTSSPDVTWAWTPQNLIDQSVPIISPQTQDTGTFATSTGTSYLDTDAGDDSGWTGTADSPQEASLKYEATDNGDGAKATATYFLTVHDEWELDASREDSRYFMEQHDMGVASACPGDPNVNDCSANASVSASFSVTPQIGGGVSGSLGVNIPIINGIGRSINLGGNVNGSLSVTGEVSGTSNWPTLTLTPGQSAVPVLNVYADHKEYDFRHYTPAGRDLTVGTNGIKTVTTNSFKGMSIGNMLEMSWRYITEL